MKTGALLLGLACSLLPASAVRAADAVFPSKPLRLVVPFEAGTYTDVIARLVSRHLSDRLRVPLVVENRVGAGGAIGTEEVARAPADGYTILFSSIATHGINPGLHRNLRYDAQADFQPLSLVMRVPNVIVTGPALKVQNLQELVAYAKANPGKVAYGSAGTGTSQHLTAELFKSLASIELLHVPYKGSQAAMTDLLGGRVQMSVQNLPLVLPHLADGKLKALAITAETRSALAPDIPTGKEAGVAGLVATSWSGMWVRAGTPAPIVSRLASEIQQIVHLPEVADTLRRGGAEAVGNSPAEFAAFIAAEIPKWRVVIQSSGAKVE